MTRRLHAGRRGRAEDQRGSRTDAGGERGGVAHRLAIARGLRGLPTQLDDPWLQAEIEMREGVRISRSQLSKALRKKKFRWRRPRHTLKGRQVAAEVERVGLRLQLRKQQAKAGDIVLLYGDESETLTHPYLALGLGKDGGGSARSGAGPSQEGRNARLTQAGLGISGCRLSWSESRFVVLDGADDEQDETSDRCFAEGENCP